MGRVLPRRSNSASYRVLLILLCFIPCALQAAEPKWQEFRTQHFTIISDAGDKKGREITLRFEQMRAIFGQLLMRRKLVMPVPLTIFAINDEQQYLKMAPLHDGRPITEPGFFVAGEDHEFIVLNVSEDDSWRAIAHQFAH